MKTTEKPIYTFRRIEICRNCKGAGTKYDMPCEVCEGNGRLDITREIKVTIKTVESGN